MNTGLVNSDLKALALGFHLISYHQHVPGNNHWPFQFRFSITANLLFFPHPCRPLRSPTWVERKSTTPQSCKLKPIVPRSADTITGTPAHLTSSSLPIILARNRPALLVAMHTRYEKQSVKDGRRRRKPKSPTPPPRCVMSNALRTSAYVPLLFLPEYTMSGYASNASAMFAWSMRHCESNATMIFALTPTRSSKGSTTSARSTAPVCSTSGRPSTDRNTLGSKAYTPE